MRKRPFAMPTQEQDGATTTRSVMIRPKGNAKQAARNVEASLPSSFSKQPCCFQSCNTVLFLFIACFIEVGGGGNSSCRSRAPNTITSRSTPVPFQTQGNDHIEPSLLIQTTRVKRHGKKCAAVVSAPGVPPCITDSTPSLPDAHPHSSPFTGPLPLLFYSRISGTLVCMYVKLKMEN